MLKLVHFAKPFTFVISNYAKAVTIPSFLYPNLGYTQCLEEDERSIGGVLTFQFQRQLTR